VLAELFALNVLEDAHASRALQLRVEGVRCEAACAKRTNFILKLFISLNRSILLNWIDRSVQVASFEVRRNGGRSILLVEGIARVERMR
jgi:hypothetical protein